VSDPITVEWLAKAIGLATKSAKFCVSGSLPVVSPGLDVDGIGAIKLPLKPAMVKQLVAQCQVAPYGKGTKTLVDKNVRNTFELDPKQFRLSAPWNSAIADVTRLAAEELGLPSDQLEARLYKLLVYQKGGFFLPHRDSEKHDRMVASLIVVLPNRFEGGSLVVRHGVVEQTLRFEKAASGQAPSYAAFYADCEHEVKSVYGGVRLCLAYNLVLKPAGTKRSGTEEPTERVDELVSSIDSWVTTRPAEPLVFALEHHYTEHGMSLDLLKGADRKLADLVQAAGEKSGCLVHLAQVERHLSQFADDGSFGEGYSSRSYRRSRHEIEIGETYEDELAGAQWSDLSGKKQPWGEIPFDLSAIVSSVPIDQWKPTSEEFEGYTGNAGNTLDRWYHRSAIVVWHSDHHFDVILSSGVINGIGLLGSMVAKLTKTPKKRLDEARADGVRIARAIIANWPKRGIGFWSSVKESESPYDEFPEKLLKLHDRETIALFLSKLAEQDPLLGLNSFVVAVCREFGWDAFARELKSLLVSKIDVRGRSEISFRDIEWLSGVCTDDTMAPGKTTLAVELCSIVVKRFCEPHPPRSEYESRYRREPSGSEESLPFLIKALVAINQDDDLARVIRFVLETPEEFRLEDCQVPSLKSLIPWSKKRSGVVHPQLTLWLDAVRKRLESATARPPEPLKDWARPSSLSCKCESCAQLQAFLADPSNKVGRIPAREEIRRHLIGSINQDQCDVQQELERRGSPYSLLLTKTTGSYDRAVKQFESDRSLLSTVTSIL
jgi:2OG-Fe(II) oxygenase superfamily